MKILLSYALQFVGLKYRWGGDDTIEGFDCSGLVQELLASVGEDPKGDQTAQALHDHFAKPENHVSREVDTGAILFFGRSTREISHVAFAVDKHRMIEEGGGGSKTLTAADAAKQNAYCRIRPISSRRDLVAVYQPVYALCAR